MIYNFKILVILIAGISLSLIIIGSLIYAKYYKTVVPSTSVTNTDTEVLVHTGIDDILGEGLYLNKTSLDCSDDNVLNQAKQFYENTSILAGEFQMTPISGIKVNQNTCKIKYNYSPLLRVEQINEDNREFTFKHEPGLGWIAVDMDKTGLTAID